jgi:hypothetical protein
MQPTPEQLQFAAIFFPHAFRKQMEIAQKNTRFVHYTSAEVAFSILTKAEVWMRNAQVMNDFSEIEYGMNCLGKSHRGGNGDRLRKVLDQIFPGAHQEVAQRFDGWLPHFRSETYLCSVSEHLDTEDRTGRLSMWRAYGGSSGVAIVVNNAPFLAATNVLGAYSSPVSYSSQDEFEVKFAELVNSIESSQDFLATQDREAVIGFVFEAFRYAVLCTKHPGFAEEREWRVIHAPTLHPGGKVVHSYQNVEGVPQSVYKIPLRDWPEEGLVGLAIPSFIDKIIIGPTRMPATLYNTFHRVLTEAGVENVQHKLFVSDIPLRR